MTSLKAYLIILISLAIYSSNSHGKNILVVGDSLSAGYGIYIHNGWVQLLQNKLSKNTEYKVINSSISGETTGGGLKRLPSLLFEHQPQIVIIELGANDAFFRTPIKEIKGNLKQMIQLSQKSNAQVLLLGMRIPANEDIKYTQSFINIYKKLSDEFKVSLVPYFMKKITHTIGMMQADGLHPNSAAQPQLLENVLPYLKPMLKTKHP